MSDVRSLISPLFPGETFADTDQVYVERKTLTVGPEGGQARTAIEEIWPAESFADDDVLVVETDRVAMSDVVVLPGDLTTDDFNGTVGVAPNSNVWVGQSAVTLDGNGNAVFPGVTPAASLQLVSQASFAGKQAQTNWSHFGNPTNGYNTTGTLRIRRAADTNHYVNMSAAAGTFTFTTYAFSATQTTAAFNPAVDKYWRVRAADQLYFETSPDGVTWTTKNARAALGWTSEACIYTVGSGPWNVSGNSSDGSTLDRYALTAAS